MNELTWSNIPRWVLNSSLAGIRAFAQQYGGLAYPSYMREQRKPSERGKDDEENKD